MKSVTEKGFPASLNYAVTRGKGEFSFRFSQLVTAASYSEADVSALPGSSNPYFSKAAAAVPEAAAFGAHEFFKSPDESFGV